MKLLAINKTACMLCFLTGSALVLGLGHDRIILSWERNVFLGLACSCVLHLRATLLCNLGSTRRERAEASRKLERAERQHRNALAGERRRRVYHLAQTVGLTVINDYGPYSGDVLSQDL